MPNKDTPSKLTIDPVDEQQLGDDEAFIDELYQTLDQQNNIEHSPSEILDKRIILAANKAVINHHNDKINKQPNTRLWNTRLWTSGLATAASLTLVISLVVQQQTDIFSPLETQPATTLAQETEPLYNASRKSSAEAFSMDLAITNETAADEAIPSLLNTSSTTNKISTYTAANRERKREDSRKSQRDNRRQVSRQISPLPKSSHSKMNQPALNNEAIVNQSPTLADDSLTNKWLIKQQFKDYLAQNNSRQENEKIHWSLLSIEQNYYQIVVYLSLNITREHRLSKQDYMLAQATLTPAKNQQDNKKFTLSDISLKVNIVEK